MNDTAAWTMEERFWLGGPDFYNEFLDPECIMAFPGMGVTKAATVLDSLKGAPRWKSVKMSDRAIGRAGDTALVLGYRAEGRREGTDPYVCFCTSTYRKDTDKWKLVQHQQTLAK